MTLAVTLTTTHYCHNKLLRLRSPPYQAYQGFAATLVMQRQSELFTQAGVYHPTILTQRESFSPARLSPPGKNHSDSTLVFVAVA